MLNQTEVGTARPQSTNYMGLAGVGAVLKFQVVDPTVRERWVVKSPHVAHRLRGPNCLAVTQISV